MSEHSKLSFAEFKDQLNKEYAYQLDGGTKYRQQTAKIAVEIASKVGNVDAFLVKENPVELVKKHKTNIDNYRLTDVAKMLRVVAGRMQYEKTIPAALVAHRKKKENEKLEIVYK